MAGAPGLRWARAADAGALAELFHAAVMIGAAADYTLEQRQAWAGPAPDPARWKTRVRDGDLWIVAEGPRLAGVTALAGECLDLLYVHPDLMGRGHGRVLHDAMLHRAQAAGLKRLMTFASHTARPVLRRWGWREVRVNHVERRGVRLTNTQMTCMIG